MADRPAPTRARRRVGRSGPGLIAPPPSATLDVTDSLADSASAPEASQSPLDASAEEHAGQVQPDDGPATNAKRHEALVATVRDHFNLVSDVESDQRRLEEEDAEFEATEQWTPEARAARAESTHEDGSKSPARPCLTVSLIGAPIETIVSEGRRARLSVSVRPRGGLATTKSAGWVKGLMRSIQADSGAHDVRMWALERSVIVGRGAYRLDVDFATDGDFDLDLIYRRILDQGTVYWDPYAQQADLSDAHWCIVTNLISPEERKRRWPDKPLIIGESAFERGDRWFIQHDDGKQSVRYAEYWQVSETVDHILAFHPKVGKGPLHEMDAAIQEAIRRGEPGTRTREIMTRQVQHVIVDGTQVLEEDRWIGAWIPIIPVVGKERIVKGRRLWKGVVRDLKDAQRASNIALSAAAELAGSAPRTPYIAAEGQMTGHEEAWEDSPIKNFVYLYYKPVALGDKLAPPPQRQITEPQIQAVMALAAAMADNVHKIIGQVDPTSRALDPKARSGKAITALQAQGASGTGNYVDNLATVSMPHEGRVKLDLIPRVYDRPGRVLWVMGEDSDDEVAVMIKRPFIRLPDGTPVPVACQTCEGKGQVASSRWNPLAGLMPCPACQGTRFATAENMPKTWMDQPVEYVDFSEGAYKLTVAIGRGHASQQEEAMEAMSALAEAAPQLVPFYAHLWVKSMSFPGATEVAEAIKAAGPAGAKGGDLEDVPPAFLAQFQALQEQHQIAVAELQKATEALRTDQIKAASQKEIAAMKIEAELGLAHLKEQSKLLQIQAKAGGDAKLDILHSQLEAMLLENEQRHDVLLELLRQRGVVAQVATAGAQAERSADREDVRTERQADRADLQAEAERAAAAAAANDQPSS